MRAGADRLIAEHAARANDTDRERHLLHRTHLYAGSVRAEEQRIEMPRRHEEGVLHVTGGMVRREIERLEHVVVVLDLRTLGHVVTELAEDLHDLLTHDRNGMARTQLIRVARHRKVQFRAFLRRFAADGFFQLLDLGRRRLLELVQRLAELFFQLLVDGAELFEQASHLALLAQETDPGLLHLFLGLALEFVQLGDNALDVLSFHRLICSFSALRPRPSLPACHALSWPWRHLP